MPGRLQLPVRWSLLRRGRPRAGVGGRRRRGQHPPLRRAPGQRRRRPARARRGHLRRGPRARRGHDVEPRGGGDAGPLPLARDLRPLPRRSRATPTCSTPWPRSATSSARSSAIGSDTRPPRRGPAARGRPRAGRAARPRPPRSAGASPTRCAGAGRSAPFSPRTRVQPRPRPRQPQDPHAAGRRAPGRGPAPVRDTRRRRGRLGRRDAAQRPAPPLPHRRRARPRRHALGRGHVGADQRDHPAADRRAGRARGASPPRSSTWAARSTTAPTRCSTSPATCPTAGPPGRRRPCTRSSRSCWRPPAGAPWPSSRAGGPPRRPQRRWSPSSPTRCSSRAISRRAGCSRSSPRDETSCLFATMGFWQGVDIPGRALSLVTIDKLPFPRPDDPLLQARRDRAGGRRLLAGRPAAGGHAAGPGLGPAHPQRRRPRRGRRARPAAGDGAPTAASCWRPCRPCGARWTSTRWSRSCGGRWRTRRRRSAVGATAWLRLRSVAVRFRYSSKSKTSVAFLGRGSPPWRPA